MTHVTENVIKQFEIPASNTRLIRAFKRYPLFRLLLSLPWNSLFVRAISVIRNAPRIASFSDGRKRHGSTNGTLMTLDKCIKSCFSVSLNRFSTTAGKAAQHSEFLQFYSWFHDPSSFLPYRYYAFIVTDSVIQ